MDSNWSILWNLIFIATPPLFIVRRISILVHELYYSPFFSNFIQVDEFLLRKSLSVTNIKPKYSLKAGKIHANLLLCFGYVTGPGYNKSYVLYSRYIYESYRMMVKSLDSFLSTVPIWRDYIQFLFTK